MPKKKTGQRKKADKQKARLKDIRNKGNYAENKLSNDTEEIGKIVTT